MIGSWRWNLAFGLFGTTLTIAFSLADNPPAVTGLRGAYAFTAFFALGYALRFMAGLTVPGPQPKRGAEAYDSGIGGHLDLVIPDAGGELNDMLKAGLSGKAAADEPGPFKPLSVPHLQSLRNQNPQELAEAVRALSDKGGGEQS